MLVVGEKINTSRKDIAEAVENRDVEAILRVARDQAAAGAHYIDVNAGTFLEKETESLCWLVETIQAAMDVPLCLDSPNPEALTEAMRRHRGEPMINSISLEKHRFESLLPVVTSRPCKVVALCMTQSAMPTTVDERVAAASQLIQRLSEAGLPREKIYVDPLVQPVSVDVRMGPAILGAISRIMQEFPGVNTICGLSNVSFGMPERRLIHRTFLALAMAEGLSAAILDPTDRHLMAALMTAQMILGHDPYCSKFIRGFHSGLVKGA